jgi:hypothetical protein
MTVPFKRSRFADRGKKAEEAVQRFLTDWASQSSTREYNRLVDSKAAGRIIKAAAADFEYCCKTAYGEEFHGLIEVKETEHEYRLSKDKLPQLPRLRKRQKCGGSGLLAFVAGLVGSRLVSAGLESAGVTPRWQWIHSGNPKDFPPHADLDGVEFTSWDDPVLESAGSGFEWVGDSFSPTNGPGGPDHNGCGCVAVLVEGGSS